MVCNGGTYTSNRLLGSIEAASKAKLVIMGLSLNHPATLLFSLFLVLMHAPNTCLFQITYQQGYPKSHFPFLSFEHLPCPAAIPQLVCHVLLSQLGETWHKRLCHFISDLMDYFLAGEDQQHTNQPNDLAGG